MLKILSGFQHDRRSKSLHFLKLTSGSLSTLAYIASMPQKRTRKESHTVPSQHGIGRSRYYSTAIEKSFRGAITSQHGTGQ